MNEKKKHHIKKPGSAPGTLVHVGKQKIEKTRIRIIDYDNKNLHEREVENIEECFPFRDTSSVTWINIDGLHDVDLIENIGMHFQIHPLVLEDILNTMHRPKMEDYDNYIYFVMKMLEYDDEHDEINIEQLSILLGKNYVISFQEKKGDVFESVRERIRYGNIRLKRRKADYLVYALIDAVVDNYFVILERLGNDIEKLETELMNNPTTKILQTLYVMKGKMITLRRSIWPLREVISSLERAESALFESSTAVYLKDVYDHTIQVIDTIESYRDTVNGMMETYLSIVSNRMNEVMKVLTIIATIFIPLTFIAGIYGMNFEYMPDLKWRWGYFVVWIVMVVIAITMIVYFKRKKWL